MITDVKYKKAICKETNETKYVSECEIILNTKIYYMEDGTSYGECQVNVSDFTEKDYNEYFSTKVNEIVNNDYFIELRKKIKIGLKSFKKEQKIKEKYLRFGFFGELLYSLRQRIRLSST
jgi:hypothetical protein